MKYVLPLPVSINALYSQSRSGRRFKVDEAKAWEQEAWYKLRKCHKFGKAKVEVFITYYFKDNRSDLGNRTKILVDMLQKLRIVDNDNQVWALHEYKEIDKENQRCEIQVDKFEE